VPARLPTIHFSASFSLKKARNLSVNFAAHFNPSRPSDHLAVPSLDLEVAQRQPEKYWPDLLHLLTAGFGTSRTLGDVRLESAKWANADIDDPERPG
jgi:hypothetical protein